MGLLPGARVRWAALGAIVAGLAVGGIAYASIPDSAQVFHACFKNSTGAVRLVNSASDCGASETATQWNQAGPTGSAGPTGPTGATGPGPVTLIAEIQTGCASVIGGIGALGVSHPFFPRCNVQFDRDVSACTSVVQASSVDGTSSPQALTSATQGEEIGFILLSLDADEVAVIGFDADGALLPFAALPRMKLLVYC
jgi:hypothetical protein